MSMAKHWQTESLRFSFLGVSAESRLSLEALTGSPADSSTSRPAQGFFAEEAVWEGQQLSVVAQPGRIDVNLVAVPTAISAPSMGDFGQWVNKFLELIIGLELPPCSRLAFGASLNQEMASSRESAEQLAKYVPMLKVDGDWSDLLFQINRPIDHAGVRINRLTKWHQATFQVVQVGPEGMSAMTKDALRLELDINTAQHEQAIPQEKARVLLNALTDEAIGLAVTGGPI